MSPQPKRSSGFSLDDYVDVAVRIQNFKDAFPEGTLQTLDWGTLEVGGKPFVWYRAAAYRTPDDPRPAHGIAWEPFPGPTAYTKDSELMNAETAAWGRAIVALGLAASTKLASRQEVRARVEANEAASKLKDKSPPWRPSDKQITELRELYQKTGWTAQDKDHERLRMVIATQGANNAGDLAVCLAALTEDQFTGVREALVEAAVTETFDAKVEAS